MTVLRIDTIQRLNHNKVTVTLTGPVAPPESVEHITVTMRMLAEEAKYGALYDFDLTRRESK